MLFFYFIAALNDATGWMLFWALLGMVFSSRSSVYFIIPAVVAFVDNADLGVFVVLATWAVLTWEGGKKAAERADQRAAAEHLIENARLQSENALHQPAKPGA